MIRNTAAKIVLAILTSTIVSGAYGESTTIAVGTQTFSIPVLPALVDMRGNARVMEMGSAVMEPSARLLTIFVERDNPGINDLEIDRYITVKTSKKWEQATLGKNDFRDLKGVLKRSTANLGALSELGNSRLPEQEKKISKALDVRMEQMSVGVPILIEVQRDEEFGYGFTYAVRYKAEIDGKSRTWVTAICNNVLLLKGKLIFINTYGLYKSEGDLQWVKNTCRDFTKGFISAN
ncbi:hypothetical protein UNDYM_4197 [Undibacterium sp. YM2]|uniref:hypothetical protein n=1 Tax=Undibacterium sp. YM2 TaxID=2058625 RepID=UPI001331E796|nr:hypothetical protein [Undibacterium sp. YM2]BBB68450.1 hypothetical protein UNDYM_4197 [Undibacterium sp. YM2]